MKFLAKMKEKQMQRKIGGMLCGLLCAGVVLVVPSAWADNYFGDDGKTHMLTGANVSLDSGNYDAVYGGYDDREVSLPEVFKNNVTITGTAATNIVCGAYSFYGNVRENTVTISGNTLGNVVCGGGTGAADAIKNHVIIEANSVVNANVAGGVALKGNSEGNTVKIIKSSAANVYGGKGDTSSKGNSVEIIEGTIRNSVYGGYKSYGEARRENRYRAGK